MYIRSVIFFSFMALNMPSFAHDYHVGDINIQHPWSRELPPNAPAGAAFFSLENQGESNDRLISVDTPRAGNSELHAHIHADGMMKMQKIPAIDIPANSKIKLQPGGLHVMLFDLKQPLVGGEQFPVTLTFEKAGKVEIYVYVEDISKTPTSMNHEDSKSAH